MLQGLTGECKLQLGRIVATRALVELIPMEEVFKALDRHATGDWGNLPLADFKVNQKSITNNGRVMSRYLYRDELCFWVITEGDRSLTSVVLESDY